MVFEQLDTELQQALVKEMAANWARSKIEAMKNAPWFVPSTSRCMPGRIE